MTSTGSGLAVPDWPNTYGYFMWAFPFSQMVGGIFYEHLHRLVASVVGVMTLILAVWLWQTESRSWLKKLGFSALLAVAAQGLLGGLTVLFLLPTPISMLHAILAQTFFCLTIGIAYFLSRECKGNTVTIKSDKNISLFRWALGVTVLIYIQLILGAWIRHTNSGLAILDFPLSDGRVFPIFNDDMLFSINSQRFSLGLEPVVMPQIAIHFFHRIGALLVTFGITGLLVQTIRYFRNHREIMRVGIGLTVLLILQVILAAFVIWTGKVPLITTFHVWTGALMLGTSLFLTLRCYKLLTLPSMSSVLCFGSEGLKLKKTLLKLTSHVKLTKLNIIGLARQFYLAGFAILGVVFLAVGTHTTFHQNNLNAEQLFHASVIYLPALLVILMIDRTILG